MPTLRIFQVAAFTDTVFGGNPAAVVPLHTWLPDRVLQAIALENALSETAYLVPRADGDGYDLRWFTPACEVELCGHATLASAYVVLEWLQPGAQAVGFHTLSGRLSVRRAAAGDGLEMSLPALAAEPITAAPELLEALGGPPPVEVHRARDVILTYGSQADVLALAPQMTRLEALEDVWAVIATAPGDDCDFVSRFFAPRKGVPEDPVTGSAHAQLVPLWAARLGRDALQARQLSARGGHLGCRLASDRVVLTGRVAPYLEGTIRVPAR